jgi:hypothetical protein
MNAYICQTCGHLALHTLPENCPVCCSEKGEFVCRSIRTERNPPRQELPIRLTKTVSEWRRYADDRIDNEDMRLLIAGAYLKQL